jgi:hypothetical protein
LLNNVPLLWSKEITKYVHTQRYIFFLWNIHIFLWTRKHSYHAHIVFVLKIILEDNHLIATRQIDKKRWIHCELLWLFQSTNMNLLYHFKFNIFNVNWNYRFPISWWCSLLCPNIYAISNNTFDSLWTPYNVMW